MNAPLKLAVLTDTASLSEECEVDYGRACPTIPEGIYRAAFSHHETAFVFKTPKVFLWFRIIDPGPCFDRLVYGAYRARGLKGKPGKNGGFKLSAGGRLFKTICRILQIKRRPDRLSLRDLRHRILRVQIGTVTKDYQQQDLPEVCRYSVVKELVGADTS